MKRTVLLNRERNLYTVPAVDAIEDDMDVRGVGIVYTSHTANLR